MSTNTLSPSLQGCRIALTIAADDPISPADELAAREAALFHYPVSQTLPPDGYDALDALLQRCATGEIRWLLLTTPCAVEAVVARMAHLDLTDNDLAKVNLATFGAKTRLTAQTLLPSLQIAIPGLNTHVETIEAMQLDANATVAIPLALRSRADWPALVAATGTRVAVAPAYRLILDRGGDDLPGLLWGGLIDAIVFFTENSVRHFVIRLKVEGGSLDMLGDVVVACLDAPTAAAAQAYNLNAQVIARDGSFATLAEALAHHFSTTTVDA